MSDDDYKNTLAQGLKVAAAQAPIQTMLIVALLLVIAATSYVDFAKTQINERLIEQMLLHCLGSKP